MKVTFISDTHTKEYNVKLPGGDILIFSGDCMGSGYNWWELDNFLEWISEQPYKHKICIPGNHDRRIQRQPEEADESISKYSDKGVKFLCDEMVEVEGLKIYGTPYQPYFCGWAFNVPDTNKLYEIYSKIPENLDILITHCPPFDILDKSHLPRPGYGRTGEEPLGSKELLYATGNLKQKPKYHCFGHIHGDGGKTIVGNETTYINASICNEEYNPVNKIITLDI